MVRQQYLVLGSQWKTIGDYVHGLRGIFHENQVFCLGSQEIGQSLAGVQQRLGKDTDEEIHRLVLHPGLPVTIRLQNRLG